MKKWIIPEVFFILFALTMIIVVLRLAPVGDPHLPGYADFVAQGTTNAQVPQVADSVALHYNRQAVVETDSLNVVGGVILDYRGYDTLFETTVLFTALISVLSIIAKENGHGEE
jgi:multicomponent Na+:H+ antiporter subunit B